jgi:hypothetical protein
MDTMKQVRDFFEACPEDWRDGYLIPVRNRLGNMVEREFLPQEMKDAFLKKFGENIIYDDVFLDWYCFNNNSSSAR